MSVQDQTLPTGLTESEKSLKTIAMVVYGLYALSCLVGFTGIIGVIIAHIKKSDAAGTVLESHFSNQIRTFWIGFALAFVGVLTAIFVIGYFIIIGAGIWVLYRTVKGFLRLNDNKAYS
ncbi:hypothetical protein [Roseomonas genomospecies 6]|uniref:DUF4870 domain-containing protein n=1 Tax=Roseomonas genomospecies 6 TaxID=214106 RepID=A0A9W7NGB6_9PROT|nr:hypothetical protein [Roseomonas genomospecies 6]KAA0676953.1 hypothetical protein DS843_25070 [Roseomonas genomospecies 6]